MLFTLHLTIMVLSFWLGLSQAGRGLMVSEQEVRVSRTIDVNPSGRGDFTTVQTAINSIPENNKEWVRILLRKNVYGEKVLIPQNKPFILLEGENRDNTIVTWNATDSSGYEDATLAVLAPNFVARNILIRNTANRRLSKDDYDDDGSNSNNKGRRPLKWTPAVYIGGDKVAFYNCSFVGQEDTLNDATGRHYFESCYIEGLVDFIWGNGQSIYQNCQIYVNKDPNPKTPGYITAQGRDSENDTTGFVFNSCSVSGNGKTFLGRAYKQYARVLFYNSKMSNDVIPEGWNPWSFVGKEASITFAEEGCTGDGADKSKRVKWEKKLSPQELKTLTNPGTFLDQEGWLKAQPKPM